jgi:hypothetical protein
MGPEGRAEDLTLRGRDLAGWSGKELVHDERIITFTKMGCIKESLLFANFSSNGMQSLFSFLVDTNIIDIEELWENGGVIGITRPSTSHRHIQDDKEWMVEDPLARDILRCELEILLVIEVPADLIFLPLNGIHMEVIPQRFC